MIVSFTDLVHNVLSFVFGSLYPLRYSSCQRSDCRKRTAEEPLEVLTETRQRNIFLWSRILRKIPGLNKLTHTHTLQLPIDIEMHHIAN